MISQSKEEMLGLFVEFPSHDDCQLGLYESLFEGEISQLLKFFLIPQLVLQVQHLHLENPLVASSKKAVQNQLDSAAALQPTAMIKQKTAITVNRLVNQHK